MTRLFYLTFLGEPRFHEDHDHHVHESPAVMLTPLKILAFLSVVGGFLSVPHLSWLDRWLEPVVPAHEAAESAVFGLEWIMMAVSVLGAAIGIAAAFKLYKKLSQAEALEKQFKPLHSILENKWYVDEIYQGLIIQPIHKASELIWKYVDVLIIDGFVLSFGKIAEWLGGRFRLLQTGSIQIYVLMILFGLIAIAGYLTYG